MTRNKNAIDAARRYPGMPALIRTIEICGSQELLALSIGTSSGLISSWLHQTRRVPLQYIPFLVAAANDPDVTPMTLRPDYAKGWELLSRQLRMSSSRVRREPAGEPEAAEAS